jgi:hypothetical protein
MVFEVQYLDGLGAWRRWTLMYGRAAAESSADRCRATVGQGVEVRVVERGGDA